MEYFDIFDKNNLDKHFKKSKEIAPVGYRFLCNDKTDKKSLNHHIGRGRVILPEAYNVYGELMKDNVGVYAKIDQ